MSFKSLITCSMLMCFSSPLFANEFYVGLGAGPDFVKFQQNAHITQVSDGILNFDVQNNTQLAGTGAFARVFAGYGGRFNIPHTCDMMQSGYLGLELNADVSSVQHTNTNYEYVHANFARTVFRMNHAYGISVLPGYVYQNNTILYARLGYAQENLEISSTDASLGNTDKTLHGFRWGFGLRQTLMPHVAVRMDYSHVNYNHATLSTLDTTSNTSKVTRITPQTNEVEFSIIYLFC